tara:strand:- start:41621 stop:42661 length:1041 start_codon:yes stop_codon:yes gene_type:complete
MKLSFIKYKYRFFIGYVLIGFFSILAELLIYSFLKGLFQINLVISLISVVFGILISFWLNIRYNFKISISKRNKALLYFFIISLISYFIQILLIKKIDIYFSYELSRIIISGSLFWLAYLLHTKFTFKDYKKVGVAIYANGVEDINQIFNTVGNYPDFIHIDIVDQTMSKNAKEVLSYKTEVIKGFWNKKFIEAHVMSKTPIKWIDKIGENVNRIYVHLNLEENLKDVLNKIKKHNCQTGIVLQNISQIKIFEEYNELVDSILVLAIQSPGYSGQKFEMKAIDLISSLNKHEYRHKISLNVDGGVNNNNISLLKSENVVSGSYVLSAENPIKNIMILQTSSQYESI